MSENAEEVRVQYFLVQGEQDRSYHCKISSVPPGKFSAGANVVMVTYPSDALTKLGRMLSRACEHKSILNENGYDSNDPHILPLEPMEERALLKALRGE